MLAWNYILEVQKHSSLLVGCSLNNQDRTYNATKNCRRASYFYLDFLKPDALYSILVQFVATYSDINDDNLDQLVMEAQRMNPMIGIRLTKGFLVAK